jgi:SAM-dependent methyltransferase
MQPQIIPTRMNPDARLQFLFGGKIGARFRRAAFHHHLDHNISVFVIIRLCADEELSKLCCSDLSDGPGIVMTDTELKFSRKYDDAHARRYFEKHRRGFWRRLGTWREAGMARRALLLAGNPQSVLDLPCGAGRFWDLLAEEPRRKIYAADLNPAMFETGLKFRPEPLTRRVEAFQASAFSIPRPDAFVECVFSIRLLHHIEKPEDRCAILREFKRVASSSIIISLWIDGNYRAMLEQRRPVRPGPSRDRYVIPRSVIEREFEECGLSIAGRVDLLKYYSMWAAYVLKK